MTSMRSIGAIAALALASCALSSRPAPSDGGRALLEAYVQAWDRHDTLAIDTLLTANGVHEDIAQGVRTVGGAQVNAFVRDVIAAEPDFDWKLTSVMVDGPRVAAEWTWTATYTGPSPSGPVTKLRVSARGASVIEVENGKIARFTDYYDYASFFPPPPKEPARK